MVCWLGSAAKSNLPKESAMSQPELLRHLRLPAGAQGDHLSAASALVRVGRSLFVVADDELHLGQFSLDDPQVAASLLRLPLAL
jgi:hypothetical protein